MTQLPLTKPRRAPGLVLALDLGTKLGFALGESTDDDDVLCRSGMMEFGHADHPGQRWLRLWSHLDSLAELGEIGVVVIEDFVGGLRLVGGKPITTRAPIVYGSFRAIVEAWACNKDLPVEVVNPMTLKKAATGKGNAKKPLMIAAANRRWAKQLMVDVVDDNWADSLCLLGAWLDGIV